MNIEALENTIREDVKNGFTPLMVIATAGDVSTGAVDNLSQIGVICKQYKTWYHIDGAYGITAAVIPELKSLFEGISEADSIAFDAHKWLYSPLEVACTLVKNPQHLIDTYSSHPVYYNFNNEDEIVIKNFYEYGFQNSRGFRALKVWLSLQQVGKNGYIKMIKEDISLSKLLFNEALNHDEIEAVSQSLSITTLRYVPLQINKALEEKEIYLNKLNERLVNELQQKGEVFLSNAVIKGKYCLRACIVNFRTSENDILETISIIVREGRKIHDQLKKT